MVSGVAAGSTPSSYDGAPMTTWSGTTVMPRSAPSETTSDTCPGVWPGVPFTSIPGAIIGGLIIGLGEELSEVYLGPMVGGGIEIWFAYMLALIFLLFRPQGLFGEKIIDRV